MDPITLMLGSAFISSGVSLYGSYQNAQAQARAAGQASKAEGESITRERVNTMIRNSYSTALSQMNLALTQRKLQEQAAGVTAAELAAKGNADVMSASTGSMGASIQAVVGDIEQKAESARNQAYDAYEASVENYNMDLAMQVVNTDQSAPTVRKYEYNGPSTGQMVGGAFLQGLGQFASSYAMRQMSLGLGDVQQYGNPAQGLRLGSQVGLRF